MRWIRRCERWPERKITFNPLRKMMPIIRIDLLAGRSPETKQQLAAEMTMTMARICGCDPAHVYVMFNDVQHHDWAVAGQVFSTPLPLKPLDAGHPS
jgi:4-oxalocrotonate tautomerase